MKVNVLGTKYSIDTDSEYLKKINADGICKEYEKKIIVRQPTDYLSDDDDVNTKLLRMKEVVRHEIIHAFFSESGLDDYSNNEQLVDWLAVQFPKLLKAFEEATAI